MGPQYQCSMVLIMLEKIKHRDFLKYTVFLWYVDVVGCHETDRLKCSYHGITAHQIRPMNASTERQLKPRKANRHSCSAQSSSSTKKRKSVTAGIKSSNAPKRTAPNRHIKTPNAGGVVESKSANTTTDSSTDGSTDSVSTDNDADDVRWSWPPRRIAVLPSPLPCPPNNASFNDYLTTSDGTPLFKNHLSKPADNLDGASPTENGACSLLSTSELKKLKQGSQSYKVKTALNRIKSDNAKEGDKELVLGSPIGREGLLWHIIRTEGVVEDGDILACSLMSPAELKKLKEGSQSYKVTVAWSLLRHMKENGEAWPTIEELKALPSDHPLSCLAN
eukprot:scaffold133924_cov72-Cyclotella_meneghiniana.AAC.7